MNKSDRNTKQKAHLSKGQLFRVGSTFADALLHNTHGKFLMSDARGRLTMVTVTRRQMRVDTMEEKFEAFCGIAEASEWKSSTRQWTTCEGPPKWLGTERWLAARL
jgi:hypothetical protein